MREHLVAPRRRALMLALVLQGCARDSPPDDEDTGASIGATHDDSGEATTEAASSTTTPTDEEPLGPQAACHATCVGAGFSSGQADVYPLETYCWCSGTGSVDQADCTALCTSLGWDDSVAFDGDACQCFNPP